MPTDVIQVAEVWTESRRMSYPSEFKPKFVIVTPMPNRVRYETWNAFAASLCEQAHKQGFAVRVTWRDGRWSVREVTHVERVEEAVA